MVSSQRAKHARDVLAAVIQCAGWTQHQSCDLKLDDRDTHSTVVRFVWIHEAPLAARSLNFWLLVLDGWYEVVALCLRTVLNMLISSRLVPICVRVPKSTFPRIQPLFLSLEAYATVVVQILVGRNITSDERLFDVKVDCHRFRLCRVEVAEVAKRVAWRKGAFEFEIFILDRKHFTIIKVAEELSCLGSGFDHRA